MLFVTFYVFFETSLQRNVKSHVFWSLKQTVKYVFSNTELHVPSRDVVPLSSTRHNSMCVVQYAKRSARSYCHVINRRSSALNSIRKHHFWSEAGDEQQGDAHAGGVKRRRRRQATGDFAVNVGSRRKLNCSWTTSAAAQLLHWDWNSSGTGQVRWANAKTSGRHEVPTSHAAGCIPGDRGTPEPSL